MPDLTDAKWDYGGSDGEIFAVIHDGVSADMDGYAARLSDTDIWNVVNYVRSVAAKAVVRSSGAPTGPARQVGFAYEERDPTYGNLEPAGAARQGLGQIRPFL